MTLTMNDILHPQEMEGRDLSFPNAPHGWTQAEATRTAEREGLRLQDDHMEVVRALQEYFSRQEPGHSNLRELHDALEERFHSKGGRQYLFKLFPGGPVAQGCRIAGLEPPAGAEEKGFGSVS